MLKFGSIPGNFGFSSDLVGFFPISIVQTFIGITFYLVKKVFHHAKAIRSTLFGKTDSFVVLTRGPMHSLAA